MRIFLLVFYLILSSCLVFAQNQPTREFRGAWVATVGNIDWPSKQGLPSEVQQQEFIGIINQLQQLGFNAVIVQIRPSADAFYPSDYEPWSHYLSGKQGVPPSPYYDPLDFMITETHKRNMEFHAWFNPFRALVDSRKNPNPATHVTRQHPEWMVNYGGKTYLNPGLPLARQYVLNVITDVVKRYDLDAVHLDDYFYPYRIANLSFNDAIAYAQYGLYQPNKEQWRRDNVNDFVRRLDSTIKQIKPYVKLGISPFGVWRNQSKDPRGSATHGGQTCYDDLYADVLLWLQKGWIDYALPQLYWEHGHKAAPFDVLLPWWNANGFGRHIYYGLGLYRMVGAKKGIWANDLEIINQITDVRKLKAPSGFALYSYSCINKVKPAFKKDLKEKVCSNYALMPMMPWLDSTVPHAPVLEIVKNGNKLKVKGSAYRYALYELSNNSENSGRKLVYLGMDSIINIASFTATGSNQFIATSFTRLWNESKGSNIMTIK